MRRSGILYEPTVKNWKAGYINFDYLVGERVRRLLWTWITTLIVAAILTGAVIFGKHMLETRTGSEQTAMNLTKIIVLLFGLGLLAFASLLMHDMHRGQTIPPLFDQVIPAFTPREPPKDGDWNTWLRKGVRIGRWQVSLDRKRTRPGPIAWMPIKEMPGIFCAGESGQGKSTFLWNVMGELKSAIRAEVVKVHLFDFKMGMEMDDATAACVCGDCDSHSEFRIPKQPLVTKDAFHFGADVGTMNAINGVTPQNAWWRAQADRNKPWGYEETAIPPLWMLVRTMRQRGAELRGQGREHMASPGNPHHVVIFDEAAQFARDHVPTRVQDEIAGLIDTLANQARALGFTVIVCTQYPSLDHIKFRHGLLWGLCLKVKTPRACDMVMGEGSWAKGKKADRLPRVLRGVGYLGESGAYGAMPLRLALTGPDITPWQPEPMSSEIELMPVREKRVEQEPVTIDYETGEVLQGKWPSYPEGES